MGIAAFFDKIMGMDEPAPIIMPEKRDPKRTLVDLIKMDIKMYPSEWSHREHDNYKIIENKTAGLKISMCELNSIRAHGTRINEVQVAKPRDEKVWNEIMEVYGDRDLQSVLEKVLARVERIETVDYTVVQEARKRELVDPFAEDHMQKLHKALAAIESAGTRSMMPTPTRIAATTPKLSGPVSSPPKILKDVRSTTKYIPRVDTWKGTPISKLKPQEFDEYMQYMESKVGY